MMAYGGQRLRMVAVIAVTSSLALCGCSSDPSIVRTTGRVADDSIAVQVPAVTLPAPNTSIAGAGAAGAGSGAAAPGAGRRSAVSTAAAIAQAGTYAAVESVEVGAGERVAAGDVLVRLDTDALEAAVVSARASARLSHARVDVLEAMADEIGDRRITLADAREQLTGTIAELESMLAELRVRRAQANDALERLQRLLASLPAIPPGSVPPGGALPTGTPVPTATPPGAGVPTGTPPGGLPGAMPTLPDPARLEAGIAQLDAAITKLEDGLAKARAGLTRLDDAGAQLTDALVTLEDVTELARIAADASGIGIRVARQQLDSATVRSPVAGVVTEVVSESEVLAPGATAARVRPDGPATVNGWLGPDDLGRVELGDRVSVSLDSRPGLRYRALLTRVGGEAIYPPTYFATTEVHLGRAVLVEARLEASNVDLPAGTPVDMTIAGSPPAQRP